MSEPIVYKLGEKRSGINISGKVQDFNKLKAQCLRDGVLFEDDSFPANDSSFYLSKVDKPFEWVRPSHLVSKPLFISEGVHRFDVIQGELGNCWFLASVANLTLNPNLFRRVVPHDQTFEMPEYAGIFHFQFWQYGQWVDVVVDDKLPTSEGQLKLMHSKSNNEFWSALLEKAYAKLYGSYEALRGGQTSEAMEDFTGGLCEYYNLQSKECPPNLFDIMLKASERSSLLGCGIDAVDASQREATLTNGLVQGHAYSVTAVKKVQLSTSRVEGKIPLVRIRNPWGKVEWSGAWSDGSREWTVVSDEHKKQLGLTFDMDGEFWMTFTDFKSNFSSLEICNLKPDSLSEDQRLSWQVSYFEGKWIKGITAGGCRNFMQSHHLNPQYMITLVDHDDDDNEDMCTCVVALMQKNRRQKRKMGLNNLSIGFAIYEIKEGHITSGGPRYESNFEQNSRKQLLGVDYLQSNQPVKTYAPFVNLREVNGRFKLKPGKYCIIPSTYDPDKEGEFLIRFFTEKAPHDVHENDEDIGLIPVTNGKTNGISDHLVGDGDGPKEPLLTDSGKNATNSGRNIGDTIASIMQILNMATTCWTMYNNSPLGRQTISQRRAENFQNSIQSFFAKLAGEDMEVDALELQQIMNHSLKKDFKISGFSLESCRSMIAMLDDDRTGKLNFEEYSQLWRNIRQWCTVFKNHDTDANNTISAHELKAAYFDIGVNVNRHILQLLIHRYGIISGNKTEKDSEKALTFDAFIHSSIKLKHSIDTWNAKSNTVECGSPGAVIPFADSTNSPQSSTGINPSFTLEHFVERVMYC